MKRSALATVAALAVLSVSACSGSPGTATPSPNAQASPSAMPTPTATATLAPSPASTGRTTQPKTPPKRSAAPRTQQPTPTATGEISGAIGRVPDGFKLPDEDRGATDDLSPFETTVWRATCGEQVLTLAAASGITGSRIKESIGPEHAVGNGLLVFVDDAAAEAFLAELNDKLDDCPVQGPARDSWRTVQVTTDLDGFGDLGVQVRQWSEWDSEGTWVEGPGASLEYIARKGRFVALTYEGGEYQGDPVNQAELVADVEGRLTAILAQV